MNFNRVLQHSQPRSDIRTFSGQRERQPRRTAAWIARRGWIRRHFVDATWNRQPDAPKRFSFQVVNCPKLSGPSERSADRKWRI